MANPCIPRFLKGLTHSALGNGKSATEWGVIVVATGDSAQSAKDEWIRKVDAAKPKTTTSNHPALASRDLQVEM